MFSISLDRTPQTTLREAGGGRHPFWLFVSKGQRLMFPLVLLLACRSVASTQWTDRIYNHHSHPFEPLVLWHQALGTRCLGGFVLSRIPSLPRTWSPQSWSRSSPDLYRKPGILGLAPRCRLRILFCHPPLLIEELVVMAAGLRSLSPTWTRGGRKTLLRRCPTEDPCGPSVIWTFVFPPTCPLSFLTNSGRSPKPCPAPSLLDLCWHCALWSFQSSGKAERKRGQYNTG